METSQSTTKPTPFRIFLASPGDVPLERKLAREAITHISSERRFRGRIDIEIIAWDQPGAAVAMEAGLTPQQAIAQGLPKPEDCTPYLSGNPFLALAYVLKSSLDIADQTEDEIARAMQTDFKVARNHMKGLLSQLLDSFLNKLYLFCQMYSKPLI